MDKYIVVWQSYGSWKSTVPFDTEKDALKHIDKHIIHSMQYALSKGDKYHYTDVQVIKITVEVIS